MPNFTLRAIIANYFKCAEQFPAGPAVPSPWHAKRKEEVGRFPEAHNSDTAGAGQTTGSLLALAALGQ